MPSLLVFLLISTDFTPPPRVLSAPNILKSGSFLGISKVELSSFNQRLTEPSADALRPINPDNAWGFCITAAAGTELASPYSSGTVIPRLLSGFFPDKSSLQPEGLHPARGVAGSGFPPLSNILDCCLP